MRVEQWDLFARSTLTWDEVREWVRALPAAVVDEAGRLMTAGREIQAAYPNRWPSIGREREEWHRRSEAHDDKVRTFLASIAPDFEPDDLLELLEAMS